ncbi:MAG: hypothetical protein AAF353_01925 [Pseudomonadota bacterium]
MNAKLNIALISFLAIQSVATSAFADCKAAFENQEMRWLTLNGDDYHDRYARAMARGLERTLKVRADVKKHSDRVDPTYSVLLDAFPDGTLMASVDLFHHATTLWSTDPLPLAKLVENVLTIRSLVHHRLLWVTDPEQEVTDLATLIEIGKERPLVVSVDRLGGPAHLSLLAAAMAFGFEVTAVQEDLDITARPPKMLIEGVDFAVRDFKVIEEELERSDLFPILQISGGARRIDRRLSGVGWIGGKAGIVARLHPDNDDKLNLANLAIRMTELGIAIIASPELSAFHQECLTQFSGQALSSSNVKFAGEHYNESIYRIGEERTLYVLEQLDENKELFKSVIQAATIP